MKILFIGTYFPRPNNPIIGTWALSQVLALRQLGHEVTTLVLVPAVPRIVNRLLKGGTSADCPARHNWSGMEAIYLRWPVFPVGPLADWYRKRPDLLVPLAWRATATQIRRIVEELKPDVLFAHHAVYGGYVATRIARETQLPCFVTEHSYSEIESCAVNSHRRGHYQEVVKHLAGWIAVSRRLQDSMKSIFPGAPVVRVLNGAEAIPTSMRTAPRPADLVGRTVVLSASFFYKRKNVPLLISAFDKIAGKHPNAVLLVIGDGEDRPAVETARDGAAHKAQIRLLGSQPHDRVLQHMVWCDAFASIGTSEPFGIVFIEAMLAGKPIIYASDGGISDVVIDHRHGIGASPGNEADTMAALDELLSDAGCRSRLGGEAQRLAEAELTWIHNARRLTALFEGSLSQDLRTRANSVNPLESGDPGRYATQRPL